MKICEKCGHPNFNYKMIKDVPICGNCHTPMKTSHQCRPTRKNTFGGQPLQGETKKLISEYDYDFNYYSNFR